MPYSYEKTLTYNQERYYWFKKHHFCTNCMKQDASTLIGHTLCFDCKEKKKKNRPTPEEQKVRSRKRYEKNKANHICVNCKHRPARPERTTCERCAAVDAMYYQKTKQPSVRDYDNACRRCGKTLDGQINLDGSRSKLCKSCYSKSLEVLEKAREVQKSMKE